MDDDDKARIIADQISWSSVVAALDFMKSAGFSREQASAALSRGFTRWAMSLMIGAMLTEDDIPEFARDGICEISQKHHDEFARRAEEAASVCSQEIRLLKERN